VRVERAFLGRESERGQRRLHARRERGEDAGRILHPGPEHPRPRKRRECAERRHADRGRRNLRRRTRERLAQGVDRRLLDLAEEAHRHVQVLRGDRRRAADSLQHGRGVRRDRVPDALRQLDGDEGPHGTATGASRRPTSTNGRLRPG
jgi:hypothetical protein